MQGAGMEILRNAADKGSTHPSPSLTRLELTLLRNEDCDTAQHKHSHQPVAATISGEDSRTKIQLNVEETELIPRRSN